MKTKKSIKNIIFLAFISIVSLFFINMSLAANNATVVVETANLRETASSESIILEQLSKGEKVEVIEKTGEWYKVKAKDLTGYLRNDLITVDENATELTNTDNTKTENKPEEVSNTSTEASNVETTSKITLGKWKIKENTKLKIVPSINATELVEVKTDDEVEVKEVLNGWVCIDNGTTKGWIRQEKLKSLEEKPEEKVEEKQENAEQPAPEQVIKTLYVNSASINVRKEASTSSEKITSLTLNAEVSVLSEENGWSKVRIDGQEGYISSSLLSATKTETSRSNPIRTVPVNDEQVAESNEAAAPVSAGGSATGNAIVSTAYGYIGSNYVYGGSSPSGFDCSGFTSYIYNQYGISLNRTAAGQYSNGTPVSRSELQPGDLVMFGKSGITHVAIYAGDGTIVHAANTSRGVTTDSITSGYYNNNYVGARRIVD